MDEVLRGRVRMQQQQKWPNIGAEDWVGPNQTQW